MSPAKIDDKTTVTFTLRWIWTLLAAMTSFVAITSVGIFRGAMWMKSVDDRLSVIEQHVGIEHFAVHPKREAWSVE